MAGDKDKLLFAAVLDQAFLQIHPVDAGHSHIHNYACGSGVLFTLKKIGCRFKDLALVAGYAEHSAQRLAHRRIVIDCKDETVCSDCHEREAVAGSVK